MKIIIGLGNPTKQYEKTRHNIGFLTLDKIAKNIKSQECFKENKKLKSEILKITLGNETVILAKPQTFMNLSGQAALNILSFYKANTKDLLVIHDDLDLPPGKIRFSKESGPAGHNGVSSIIESLGTNDFTRVRIGIAPENPATIKNKNFVLNRFMPEEEIKIKKAIEITAEAAEFYVEQGFEKSATKFN